MSISRNNGAGASSCSGIGADRRGIRDEMSSTENYRLRMQVHCIQCCVRCQKPLDYCRLLISRTEVRVRYGERVVMIIVMHGSPRGATRRHHAFVRDKGRSRWTTESETYRDMVHAR